MLRGRMCHRQCQSTVLFKGHYCFFYYLVFSVCFFTFYRPVAFLTFQMYMFACLFCVFAILFSRLHWVLLLLVLFLLLLSISFFIFDMNHWSDTNKWLNDWLMIVQESRIPPRDARVRLSYEKQRDVMSEPFVWAVMFFIATFTYTAKTRSLK